MSDLHDLKKLLSTAINTENPDFDQILTLATEMAKQDTDKVRFSVDASHISRLGIELVSKQETAVAELVKNAFDADATMVNLVFENSSIKGGVLTISDNGQGMSREQLLDGFMRISTQDKFLFPISSKYMRQKAGRKGIGRFATQRLGCKLIISTQQENAETSFELEIDWNLFERGKDLQLISSQIKVQPKLPNIGTELRLENLRDVWTEAQIQRAYRYISELLQPFPLDATKTNFKNRDPGFKVTFKRELNGETSVIASEDESIYAHSTAKFSGYVGEDGIAYINISSPLYKINIENKALEFDRKLKPRTGLEINSYPLLSGVRFNAHYFISDELPSGTKSIVSKILSRQGGVRVYRNGFRVLPYGEAFDDWLGFQRSSALRELLPPHHNSNFLGFTEITDVMGKNFEETASREGLLENEAFTQLQDFIYRAIMTGVITLARARGKKVFSSEDKRDTNGDSTAKEKPSPKVAAAEIAEKIRLAAKTKETTSKKTQNELPGVDEVNAFEELAKDVEGLGVDSQAILEENGMLRVLASLGLTIGEFTHEVRHALAALKVTVEKIERDGISPDSIVATKENMFLLQSYARYFDNAITQNAHRKLSIHELRDLVGEFIEVVQPTLNRQNIKLTSNFEGYDLFTKPMHKSEWSSILLNLFTNSLKAIQRARSSGQISIVGGRLDGNVYLEFSDNGDGIPEEHSEKIFDAFFTTSAPSSVLSYDSDKLVGTGLGLKIVRDIVNAANGEIYTSQPKSGYSTCFRIEVPQATDEEIGDEKY